ncbi:MAG: xanthine dehydrogenase family protein [Armatimonadetes bacterium]|nr:xanthine dehydrogenase family protein [Armatimonadota bacterium]
MTIRPLAPGTRHDGSRWIGQPIARVEDRKFVRGAARYVDELTPPRTLHLAVVRSAHAHARVRRVDYDPLPAVADPQTARSSAVRLPDNEMLCWDRTAGDVEGAFRAAAAVVREHVSIPRLAPAPMETRGAGAAYDPGTDQLTVWVSAQDPHRPRTLLAQALGRPEERVRVITPDVGGGFGGNGHMPSEVILTALLAMRYVRPVKWIEDRTANLQTGYHGRGLAVDVEAAFAADRRLLAMRASFLADLGAYLYPPTPLMPITTAMLMTGTHHVPAAEARVVGVATNRSPTGPYRGAGRPEAALIAERVMDGGARALAIDPIEIRKRNVIPPDRIPFTTALGMRFDSGDYTPTLERLVSLMDLPRRREAQARARAAGRLSGIGIALYVEHAGARLWESAAVRVEPDGRVVVRRGSNSHGQGHHTVFAQVVAEVLRLDLTAVTIEQGDSAVVPRGVGTFGSRSMSTGAPAAFLAALRVKEKMSRIAARLLEASEDDLAWQDDRIAVRGAPDRGVPFAQVASIAYDAARLPAGLEMGLETTEYFRMTDPVFPFGAYGAIVDIDPETGVLKVEEIFAVDNAGRILNPWLAEGQVFGGIVQGFGEAVCEEFRYDEFGQPRTNTLADYAMPRAAEVPLLHGAFLETPSPNNPLGTKGIGEAGAIGTPAAIANAVADALHPIGNPHVQMPYTPEKLWRAIHFGKPGRP